MNACTVWLIGAPGAERWALAQRVEGALLERGLPAEIVDGGEMGANLRVGLGVSAEDEATYARRIGHLCRMLSRNGIVAIATEVAPRGALCDEARASLEHFLEVRIASAGGAAAPGAPGRLELVMTGDPAALDEGAARILLTLETLGFIPPAAGRNYSADEEEGIKSRLRDLGYI